MGNKVTVKTDIPQTVNYQSCTVQAGTTTTLQPGQDATVTNTGTEYNAVLNFGIPRGKSAYEQAVEGGYQGTEAEFEQALASDISTVADNIEDVNTVAANISDIHTVAENVADVNTVATDISNINTVAGISSDVSQVAGISSAVSTVSSHDSDVTLVSDNMASVMTTASNIGDVSTVAGISADVSTVAGNNTNVTTVATNISNVNTAATNMSAIIAAPTAAQNAATSATNAQKWAEGTDSDVTPLGGTHSSKGWADVAKQYAESIGAALKYKGSVASYSALPSTGQEIGDMWNVLDTGKNYAWTGTEWDDLSGAVDLSAYRTAANQDIIDGNLSTAITNHTGNTGNPHSVTASQVGLGNVDNTSDLNKPISTATQTALDGKQPIISSTNMLSSDLVDDTNHTNKFVTASDKTTWNGKQDALVSGTNIKTVNGNSLLGSGNVDINGLPSQTGQSGKFLTTNGTSASWSDKPLANEAVNNIQLNIRPAGGTTNTADRGGKSIIIGSNIKGGAYNDDGSIRIGNNINSANDNYGSGIYVSPRGISKTGGSIIIDGSYNGSSSNDSGMVGGIILGGDNGSKIGPNKGAYSVIIGSSKLGANSLNADNSTFIGNGNTATTITEDNTFWWGNNNGVYKLVDANGTIPVARLNTMTGADGANAGAKGAVPAPAATDNTKYLKGDGTWAVVDALPSQAGNQGKYLTTNGTTASWDIPMAGLPMFYATYQPRKLNNASWLRADPYSWHSADLYVSAYAHLADNISGVTAETETIAGTTITFYKLSDEIKVVLPDQQTNLDTIYNATGIGYYFVLDTTNRQFKLPRNIYGFTGYRGDVGGYVAESLPQHTHSPVYLTGSNRDVGDPGNLVITAAAESNGIRTIADSSTGNASSSVYQSGAPVQQRATQAYLYFYVGNTVQNETSVDVAEMTEALNDKVDLSSSWGTLSTTYDDLTEPNNNGYIDITAPADGWLYYARRKANGDQNTNMWATNTSHSEHFQVEHDGYLAGTLVSILFPVKKGNTIRFGRNNLTSDFIGCRFYYAQKTN